MSSELHGRVLVGGEARGRALVIPEGISFAMAFDPVGGIITDVHGDVAGVAVTGRVMVMASGRGSSSASTALAEAMRLGTAPAGIILGEVDEILAVGAIIGGRLYGATCPILVLAAADRARIDDGCAILVADDGRVVLDPGDGTSAADGTTKERQDG
jgi:predicted aconitase with swiveling domain